MNYGIRINNQKKHIGSSRKNQGIFNVVSEDLTRIVLKVYGGKITSSIPN